MNPEAGLGSRRRKSALPVVILLLTAVEAVLFYYFQIYLNQIDSIEDICITLKQHSKFSLPQTVEARLKNKEYEKLAVHWDRSYIDTDVAGDIHVEGKVQGYKESISLKVKVVEYVSAVERPQRVMLEVEKGDSVKAWGELPQYLSVEYSSGAKGWEKVLWDRGTVNWAKSGVYQVAGSFETGIDCEPEITCRVEIINRSQALERIIFDGKFLKDISVRKTLDSIEKLPDTVLEALIEGDMCIKYVSENITDMPEFRSLKNKETSNLKVFGVFKYPQIVVDCQAEKYVNTREKDEFYTITIHEIGHAYDYLFDGNEDKSSFALSSKEEFYSIWRTEGPKLFNTKVTKMSKAFNDYYINAEYEYFAECFSYYFAGDELKDMLRKNAPRTYDFISKCVNIN